MEKTFLHLLPVSLLFFLFLIPAAHAEEPTPAWQGVVLRVYDGDTLDILKISDGSRHRIRLADIDAPELDQPGGPEAAAHLRAISLWKVVSVEDVGRDRYKRLLAVVSREGAPHTFQRGPQAGRTLVQPAWSLNGNMVRMGHAWTYPGKLSKGMRWRPAEVRAIQERRGIWREKSPTPPWTWREKKR